MSTTTTPTEPTTSSLNPFNLLGGLASDVVELTKSLYNEATEVPTAIADGWKNGAMLKTENSDQLTTTNCTEVVPSNEDIDEEILRLQKMKNNSPKEQAKDYIIT